MKIYKLHRLAPIEWGKYIGFVIRAVDEEAARVIAQAKDSHIL